MEQSEKDEILENSRKLSKWFSIELRIVVFGKLVCSFNYKPNLEENA